MPTIRPPRPFLAAPRLLRLASLALLVACGGGDEGGGGDGGPTGTGPAVAEITLSPGSTTLQVGQRATFTAQLRDSSGAVLGARTLEWTSSNPSVATVANGVVTGVGAGAATVSARSGTVQGTALFTVIGTPTGDISVTAPADSVLTGATLQLSAIVRDAQGRPVSGARVTWSSVDTLLARVSSTGVVTGRLSGTVLIRATSGTTVGHLALKVRESQPIADVTNSLALGQNGACALTTSGEGWCWGRTSFTDDLPPNRLDSAEGPGCYECVYLQRVPGGHRFRQIIAVSPLVFMGLTADGEVYVWGRTQNTAHWQGTEAYRPRVVPTSARFTKISALGGLVFGLTADGQAYGWGESPLTYGRDNATRSATPVPFGGALRFRDVAVSGGGVAFVTTTGDLYYSRTTAAATRPERLTTTRAYQRAHGISGNGRNLFIATTAGGQAYNIGVFQDTPLEEPVGNGNAFVQVMSGSTTQMLGPGAAEEDIVGLSADGRLYTFGQPCGSFCQAGQPAPVREVWPERRWQAVATALYGTIAMAADDSVYGWGRNDNGRLAVPEIGATLTTPRIGLDGQFRPFVSTLALSVPQGGRVSHTVRFHETMGSMTRHGPRRWTRPRTVEFWAPGAPSGVTGTVYPSTILGDGAIVGVSTSTSASTSAGTYTTFLTISPANPMLVAGQGTGVNLTVTPPPPPPGTPLDLRCSTGSAVLPAGFQCLTNPSGAHVPGKFAGDASFNAALHGTWVDSGAGICINWQANGQATVRYSPDGIGGNGPSSSGPAEWGVLVRRDGTPEGTATQWYVYTDAADDQTKILGVDTGAPGGTQIMGWQFRRQGCPW